MNHLQSDVLRDHARAQHALAGRKRLTQKRNSGKPERLHTPGIVGEPYSKAGFAAALNPRRGNGGNNSDRCAYLLGAVGNGRNNRSVYISKRKAVQEIAHGTDAGFVERGNTFIAQAGESAEGRQKVDAGVDGSGHGCLSKINLTAKLITA